MSTNNRLEPFAVPIPETSRLLGGKSIAGIYDALKRGRLEAVKDGNKTLVTTRSIEAYTRALPAFKPSTSK